MRSVNRTWMGYRIVGDGQQLWNQNWHLPAGLWMLAGVKTLHFLCLRGIWDLVSYVEVPLAASSLPLFSGLRQHFRHGKMFTCFKNPRVFKAQHRKPSHSVSRSCFILASKHLGAQNNFWAAFHHAWMIHFCSFPVLWKTGRLIDIEMRGLCLLKCRLLSPSRKEM